MQVKLDTKTVTVEKLKLNKYAEVLSVLETIPTLLGELSGKSNDDIFALLPKLVARALPEVIKILTIATSLSEPEVNDLGLDEAIQLLVAIFEVNKIGRVAENLTKLFRKSSPSGNGSTNPLTSSPQNTVGPNSTSSTSTQTNSTTSTL